MSSLETLGTGDWAQSFKSGQFEEFCNDNKKKLILAPAGDHSATGMIEKALYKI